MRGHDDHQDAMFSYISPDPRVPRDRPLRPIRARVNQVLQDMSANFSRVDSTQGRPSIPPEQLLTT